VKTRLIILTLSLAAFQLQAQVDSVQVRSLLTKADSIRAQKLSGVDSVNRKVDQTAAKINNVNDRLTDYDTLGQKAKERFENEKSKLTSKIDSLKAKNLPYDKYAGKLDSLSKIDPLEKLKQQKQKISGGQGKLNSLENKTGAVEDRLNEGQSKIQKLQDGPQGKVNEKLDLLSKESQGKGALPSDLNVPGAKLPDSSLPDTKPPGADLNVQSPGLPDVDKPALDADENPLNKNLGSKLNVPEIKKPGELEKIGDVQDKVSGEVGDVTEKVSGYSEDAKNISKGNVDEVKTLKEDAMKEASLDKEMGLLNEGEKTIVEQKAMLDQMKNPEEYRKQTIARGKAMMIKQMAAREQALQEAMTKVSKYQTKAGTVLSKKSDLPKRRDPLKNLKFYEKFVPGITLQIQKSGVVMLDVNPSLRYRLTSYWCVGAGWNERLIFGSNPYPMEQTRLYGVRSFTEIIIFKGIAMRLDAERMNGFLKPVARQQDIGSRDWVMIYMAGLKKEFTFVPRVVGNVQFMYNLYDPKHYRVYPTRFNVRFGFEFPLKRRKK
jgi:hypothetical protein